jgi:lipopolysaccharide transport system permease protein
MSNLAVESTQQPGPAGSTPEPEAVPARRPHLVIEPKSGWSALDLAELWRFRDLLFTLGQRDLKLRYKQTALGVVWVILQPLLAAGVFAFVFGKVARLPSEGVPYFLFSYAGLLGWNLFANTLTKTSGCLIGNSHLISKVFFPRLVLPLSTIPSTLVDFGVAMAMMVVMMFLYQVNPGVGLLLLPVWMGMLLAIAMGIGLITSSLAVSYRDVNYILPVLVQILLYASPVAYAVSAVPEHLQKWYYLNPLAGVLEAFRWSLIGTSAPRLLGLLVTAVGAVAILTLGLFMFKKMERQFADVI